MFRGDLVKTRDCYNWSRWQTDNSTEQGTWRGSRTSDSYPRQNKSRDAGK